MPSRIRPRISGPKEHGNTNANPIMAVYRRTFQHIIAVSLVAAVGFWISNVGLAEQKSVPTKTASHESDVSAEPSWIKPPAEVQPWIDDYEIQYAERRIHDLGVPKESPTLGWDITERLVDALESPHKPLASLFSSLLGEEHDHVETNLEERSIGIQPIYERPNLLLELNEKFLGPGFLSQGVEIPTGAVWRPAFWVFGTYRTGIAYRENQGGSRFTEWAQRLDLFGQLNLSGTERLVVGLRSVDQEVRNSIGRGGREFNSYDFRSGDWIDGWNSDVQTLFFEGDFGELFPNLDPYDVKMLDWGFSVGRQPMSFQQGLLINEDMIDAVTVTRNTLYGSGNLNLRATGVFAWNRVNRHDQVIVNRPDNESKLYGLFTESDFSFSTVNLDVVFVDSDDPVAGDLWAFGASAIQRFNGFHNTYNTSFHILASFPSNEETTAATQGELLFSQISWTPHSTEDLIYVNGFWAIDQFTSATRGPLMGGPLGQTGILFAHSGLGRYGPPLGNQAADAAGASIGYQLFYDHTRQQVIFELGGRKDTNGIGDGAIAAGVRYQKALGQHWIFLIDSFIGKRESLGVGEGLRFEFLAKF